MISWAKSNSLLASAALFGGAFLFWAMFVLGYRMATGEGLPMLTQWGAFGLLFGGAMQIAASLLSEES